MNNKIILVGGGIFIIIMIVLAIGSFQYNQQQSVETEKQNKIVEHATFCKHWSNNIEQTRQQVDSAIFPSDTAISQLNDGINQYNKECAF